MPDPVSGAPALRRIEEDGLAARVDGVFRTTRKWQRAMARAALHLYENGDPGEDLRVPIASALLELYGDRVDDEELAGLVEGMLPIELRALGLERAQGTATYG
jgi:hypothetical protein